MYRKHFALTDYPFDLKLAPEDLFASATLGEAEARLKHLLELRAIGLVTGEAGSGKTTVCRKIASALHPGLYRVFYVPLSTGNVMDMYKSIAWELGLPTERNRASAFRVIRAEITRLTLEAKQRPVLIVDEAHHLRNEVLEDLRLLTNYEMDSQNRLCLLLVGLTELRRRLAMAVHESLAQRIVVRHHLAGLGRDELPEYLTHRLRRVGCELPLFEPPAVEALFQATQGMPRKVNRLAHYALTSAALNKAKTVATEHVQAALEEIDP
jgi:type II secretory pathway predicted ATPase ExeA